MLACKKYCYDSFNLFFNARLAGFCYFCFLLPLYFCFVFFYILFIIFAAAVIVVLIYLPNGHFCKSIRILKVLETSSLCFTDKYTALITADAEWTQNLSYCTNGYASFILLPVCAAFILLVMHSHQSLTLNNYY